MVTQKAKKALIVLTAVIFSFSALAVNSFSQSFWERRQKSQEQMRQQQEGTVQDRTAPPAQPEAVPIYNDEDFDLGLGLMDADDYDFDDFDFDASTIPFSMPFGFGLGYEFGNKEIKKLADKSTFIDPKKIRIDENYGTVREVHISDKPNAPLVVHVQDAHANFDAQLNIAHIIENLLADYGIYYVCMEGGTLYDVNPITHRMNETIDQRIEKANQNLRDATFKGMEYLYVVTEYPLQLRGIEDPEIYEKNVDLYFEVESLKPKAKTYLDSLKINVQNLKAAVFSKELKEISDNKENYLSEKITLNAYVKFLDSKAKDAGIGIKSTYPNTAKLLETILMEEEIIFPEVDAEREKLLESLKSKMSAAAYKKVEDSRSDFIVGKLKARDFYSHLISREKKDVIAKNYKNLQMYAGYLDIFGKIDAFGLFRELEQLESQIKASLFKNEDEKSVDKLAYDLGILSEFVELGLTPDEYAYYSNNRRNFVVSRWASDIQSLQRKYKLNKPVPRNSSDAQRIIPKLEDFYRTAILRDKYIVERTLGIIKESDSNACIMVCGGFHTPRITGIMRTLGVSYVVISPKINTPTEPGLYNEILKKQREKRDGRRR